MIRRLGSALLVAALVLTGSAASARPVAWPSGASWVVAAPEGAGAFANAARPSLTVAGTLATSLLPARLDVDLVRRTGLPLLDAAQLDKAGVDTSRPWVMFAHRGSTYLHVGVKNTAALSETLDLWARMRLLKREESALPGRRDARQVLYARSEGARAVAGWVRIGDEALVLIEPGRRDPGLREALEALERAAPIEPSVPDPLVALVPGGDLAKDLWVGVEFRRDGVDLHASTRTLSPGWVVRDERRGPWVAALLGQARHKTEPPIRARAVAGGKLLELLSTLSGTGRVMQAGPGAVEAFVPRIDPFAASVSGLDKSFRPSQLAHLMPMAVAVVDRPLLVMDRLMSHAGESVRRSGTSVVVASQKAPALPPPVGGEPALSCGRGEPVASVRLDPALVARSIDGLSLSTAMRADLLLGVYGIDREYGRLLAASHPLVALACEEPSGRARATVRWRWKPPAGVR